MFKTIHPSRIYENVIQQIRDAILENKLKPGDKLPAEKDLSQRFGVSKASVREAFRALEAIGLLEIHQGVGGGAFVREVDFELARENLSYFIFFQNPSIAEFTELRLILEPKTAEIAAQRITDSDIKELGEILAETEETLKNGSCFYEKDIAFHRKIAQISGNPLVIFIVDSMQNALVSIKKFLQPDIQFSRQVHKAHMKIYEAMRERNSADARNEMEKHVREVEEGLEALSQTKNLQTSQLNEDSKNLGFFYR